MLHVKSYLSILSCVVLVFTFLPFRESDMSTSKKAAVRSAKSTTRYTRVRLSQIRRDAEHDYCHRSPDAFKATSLAPMADSVVQEGLGTPVTVYNTGKKDKNGEAIMGLVGGHIRIGSIEQAIRQNLDPSRINPNMELDAIEIVRGEEQTEEEFRRDLLMRSIVENEQRNNYTTVEKLGIAKQCRDDKVPDVRAASALAVSETQYRRFVSIVEHPWLHQYVVNNCIGATDAAELIGLAVKNNRVAEFQEDLTAWVESHRRMIEAERQELAQVKKKLSGAAAQVKKYASPKLVKHWQDCLEHSRRFDENINFLFGIHVDYKKGTVTIPAAEWKLAELTSTNIATVIGELQEKVDEFIPLLRQRRMLEESTEMSAEEVERERARIREQRRQEKERKAKAEAGQPAPDFDNVDEPRLWNIDEAIGDDNESLDDDIDEPAIIDADEPEADVDANADN
jgi:hypothetical protein